MRFPDSTTDFRGSQGFVRFRLKPVKTLQPGDEINNSVDIFFDFNPPVHTNAAQTVVSLFPSGQGGSFATNANLTVFPNPASLWLTCSWKPSNSPGTLRLVDLNGVPKKEVAVAAGAQKADFQLGGLAPGNYWVVLEVGQKRAAKQVAIGSLAPLPIRRG